VLFLDLIDATYLPTTTRGFDMLNKFASTLFFGAAVFLEIAWRLTVFLSAAASTSIIIASLIYAIAFADWRAVPVALLALPLSIWSQNAFCNGFDDQVADAVLDFGDRILRRCPTA
jgi:hypothetical protein